MLKHISGWATTNCGLRPLNIVESTLAGPGEASTGKKKARTDKKSITISVYEILFHAYYIFVKQYPLTNNAN